MLNGVPAGSGRLPGMNVSVRPCGLVVREEACWEGVSPRAAEAMVRRGRWVRLQRGIYAEARAEITPSVRAAAAVLAPDCPAVASHQTAARAHGIDVVGADLLRVEHITVPRGGRRPHRPTLRIHSGRLDAEDIVEVDGIPVTSPARTVRDLLIDAPRLTGIWAAEHAQRLGLVTRGDIDRQIERATYHPRIRAARLRWPLADAGSESPLETGVRLAIVDGGLPAPELQIPVLGYRIDMGYPAQLLGIEADGRTVHDRLEALYADRTRANLLEAGGWRLLRFTWADLRVRRSYIPAAIRAASRRAA